MKTSGDLMITDRGLGAIKHLAELVTRARKAKAMPRHDLAARARISVGTLIAIERGAPGVSLWAWINVLEMLGLLKHIESLRDPATDALVGNAMPKRIRRPVNPPNPDF